MIMMGANCQCEGSHRDSRNEDEEVHGTYSGIFNSENTL